MPRDVVGRGGQGDLIRVTVTTIEIPPEITRDLTSADELSRAVATLFPSDIVAAPAEGVKPAGRRLLWRWSPLKPFATIRANYRTAREALGASGSMSLIYVCIAAGLASVVWRHAMVPISIVGGLLVAGILFVRTGAYREYLAAIEEVHGLPSLGIVIRYNIQCLLKEIKTRWRP
jgi:hypothetical protein